MGAWQQKKGRKGCSAREAQANCCQYVCNANKLYLIKGTRVTDTPRPLPRTNVLRRGCSCQTGPISLFIQPYSTLPSCCSSATTFSSCELLCIDDALEMPFDVLIEARFRLRLRLRVRPAPHTLHLPIRHIRLDAPLGNVSSRGEAWQRQRGKGNWELALLEPLRLRHVECLLSCLSICRPLFNQYIDTHFICSPPAPRQPSAPAQPWVGKAGQVLIANKVVFA